LKKLSEREIQPGKVFHSRNGEKSVRVLEVKTIELYSSPCRVVFSQDVEKHRGPTGLPMDLFCAQYKRRKRKI